MIVLSLMLLLWMNDRRQEMGVLVSLGIGKPSLIAQYLTEMILIGLPSLVLGWLCARGAAQWLAPRPSVPRTLRGEGTEQHGTGRRRS